MASPASVKGHPFHPMLVVLPVGLWIFSFVADLVRVSGGAPDWESTALRAIGVGIIGALLAAVPGLIDLLSISDPAARRKGIAHMVLNLCAVAVFAIDFWLRWHGSTVSGAPIALSVVGLVLISISGWLGGDLVYVHGVGVEGVTPTRPR